MVRGFRGLRFERVAAMSPPYPVSGVLKRAALWLYRRRRQAPPGRITGNNPFLARNPGVSPPSSFSTFPSFPFRWRARARTYIHVRTIYVSCTFFRSVLLPSLSLFLFAFVSLLPLPVTFLLDRLHLRHHRHHLHHLQPYDSAVLLLLLLLLPLLSLHLSRAVQGRQERPMQWESKRERGLQREPDSLSCR